jgi:DNA primase
MKQLKRKPKGIAEVINCFVKLQYVGSGNWKGICPFHKEKTPSFVVSEDKEIFKCFGCGKAGNLKTFLRDVPDERLRKLDE